MLTNNAVGGPNPAFNPRLASAILRAKKASCTKENIDNAIARGQGRSASGAALKTFLDGAMLPELGGVSILIDCLTDNQKALQMDIRIILKAFAGTPVPTTHQFAQVGRISWPPSDEDLWLKFVDGACEREELGVEEYWKGEDGEWMVELPVSSIKDMEDHIASKTGVTEASSEIIWKPLETVVIDSEASNRLQNLIDELEDLQDVRAVYSDSTLSTP
jgi:transcriptional/translational regulatory protein YebC/TACO1